MTDVLHTNDGKATLHVEGAIVISTPEGITRYQMLVVKHGLQACKIGMRVNTFYTPKNLRRMVETWTAKKFKARDYDGMIAVVVELIEKTNVA